SSRHALITDDLIASSCALDEFLVKKLLEKKSLKTESDFCDLHLCDYTLQYDLVCSETDRTWYLLRLFLDNCVALRIDDILVYNTFFEKCLENFVKDSQSELTLLCFDFEKNRHILRMIDIVACLDTILVYKVNFDMHLERLKLVVLVLGKYILICYLNKYLSC